MKDVLTITLRAILLVAFTVLSLEAALQLAFPHLPREIIRRMPQYQARLGHRLVTEHGALEYPAGEVVDYEMTPRYGDLYDLSCLPRDVAEEFAPYRVSFRRDAHGFRNDEPWPDDVDLVVMGDSFTNGGGVQAPYWQGLSDATLALGVPGTGTLEQQRLFEAYALPRKPETAVLAFFAGNDLNDTQFFADMQRDGITRHDIAHRDKNPLDYSVVFRLLDHISDATVHAPARACHYPRIAHTDPETLVAFANFFLPTLGADREALLQSEKLRLTRTSIGEMTAALRADDGEMILMYIPSKPELYWPYLDDLSKSVIVHNASRETRLKDLDTIDDNLRVQRDVMREIADELGIAFLDLTPPLDEAIRAGQSPYFFADTHWNQLGHDIARNALLDFLNRPALAD